ncbi:hypothetical protein HBE96_17405 [Clostridium sp. P21]|uniref:Uncharacterized protein n=1 Tax=Clostridium muellerianum TaxID=2716538 RepID=A0A7Y0EJ34_9CLOT|nr:hypothetical protein [Clostridium muellerianum]NMM64400.1 hypothetical protein [Clostridium muellerianum]
MENYLIQIMQLILGLVIIIITPFAYKTLTAFEKKAIAVAGESNYNFIRTFVVDIVKSKPNEFYENELVEILDIIDNRFGNKFTKNEIEMLVDATIKDFGKTVKSLPIEPTGELNTDQNKLIQTSENEVIEKLQETLDILKNQNKQG